MYTSLIIYIKYSSKNCFSKLFKNWILEVHEIIWRLTAVLKYTFLWRIHTSRSRLILLLHRFVLRRFISITVVYYKKTVNKSTRRDPISTYSQTVPGNRTTYRRTSGRARWESPHCLPNIPARQHSRFSRPFHWNYCRGTWAKRQTRNIIMKKTDNNYPSFYFRSNKWLENSEKNVENERLVNNVNALQSYRITFLKRSQCKSLSLLGVEFGKSRMFAKKIIF